MLVWVYFSSAVGSCGLPQALWGFEVLLHLWPQVRMSPVPLPLVDSRERGYLQGSAGELAHSLNELLSIT